MAERQGESGWKKVCLVVEEIKLTLRRKVRDTKKGGDGMGEGGVQYEREEDMLGEMKTLQTEIAVETNSHSLVAKELWQVGKERLGRLHAEIHGAGERVEEPASLKQAA